MDFDAAPPFGPWLDIDGQPIDNLGPDDIVLNQWTADDSRAQGADVRVGMPITLTFFEPESTHGETAERRAKFLLKAVVPMSGPALDRELTPELKGITDRDSLANWDPPFPYDPQRVRSVKPHDEDEAYWDEFRTTPKAFVSAATGRALWKSRFGTTTGLRFTTKPTDTKEALEDRLAALLPAKALGFALMPVKRIGLNAASGTTPFDGLFLGFSMFLIAAALLLIGMLFKLGLERRARELGIELAHGFTRSRLRTRYLLEGGCVALFGSLLGAAAGIGFAALMIHGLRTWWLAAITTPFIRLHVEPRTLAIGAGLTFFVALATMLWTLRSLKKVGPRNLLAGRTDVAVDAERGRSWATGIIAFCAFGAGADRDGDAALGRRPGRRVLRIRRVAVDRGHDRRASFVIVHRRPGDERRARTLVVGLEQRRACAGPDRDHAGPNGDGGVSHHGDQRVPLIASAGRSRA
ncbi:MAG: ABC transporter permease [Pirellulales bacterium]